MAKHTPGPWVVEVFATLQEAIDQGGFEWADREMPGPIGDGPVGAVFRDTGSGMTGLPGSIETTLANARLIAAAPDLYAACLEAFAVLDGIDSPIDDPEQWKRQVRTQLLAATRKAEGAA